MLYIKDSGTSLEKAEVKLQIAELISSLADIKIELADVQGILIEKDEGKDGPFCQQCYDNENKLIRLQGGGTSHWHCLSSKGAYIDSNYRQPNPIHFS